MPPSGLPPGAVPSAPARAETPEHAEGERRLSAALVRLGASERDAFVRFVELTRTHLIGTVLRLRPCEVPSRDLLRCVYLELWDRAPDYDPTTDAASWILDVVVEAVGAEPPAALPVGAREGLDGCS